MDGRSIQADGLREPTEPLWASVNNAARNVGVQIFLPDSDFILLRYLLRSRIAGSYGH